MIALVTGASSGIGKDITYELIKRGYEVIAVAREQDKLDELKSKLYQVIECIAMDLSIRENCFKLYEMTKKYDIDILVNNAGFGTIGNFTETDLAKELGMIDTNCIALHILFKLYLKDMVKKNKGYILNVASIASFSPGPNMATYFATKSYVYRLTQSVYQELKWKKSKVKDTALCPSPTRTAFDKTANVLALFSLAFFSITLATLTSSARYTTGTDGLIIPAFSLAIFSIVSPSISI